MNLVFGEILFDIFPKYRRLGGAPFNVAFHLKHFGVPVRFISRVGSDPQGEEIRGFLSRNGFHLEDVQVDVDHPTGSVRVDLDDKGVPQFARSLPLGMSQESPCWRTRRPMRAKLP